MQALGFSFKDDKGIEIGPGGGELIKVASIDSSNKVKQLSHIEILVACDVDNPLLGKKGATYIYGPQKGASESDLVILEEALEHFHNIIEKDLGEDVKDIKGAGAAGGLGAGVMAFLDGRLTSGVKLMMEQIHFEDYLKKYSIDLIITGEGKMDFQTLHGKLPIGIGQLARKHSIPTIAISGMIDDIARSDLENNFYSMFSLVDDKTSLEKSLKGSKELLSIKAGEIIKTFLQQKSSQ